MKDVVNELLEKIVAIDNGYWNTKVCTEGEQFSFESKIEQNDNPITSVNSDIIQFEGNQYVVGEGAKFKELEKDKTTSIVHKICAYNALARLTEPNKLVEYKIIIGMPIDQYVNDVEREKFVDYIKGKGTITVKSKNFKGKIQDKLFKIADVKVFPQCAGVLYSSDSSKFEDSNVGIIDIGGGTAQGCVFSNMNIIPETAFSYNSGMYYLITKIRNRLNSELNKDIQPYEMNYIFKNGVKGDNKKKSLEIIKEEKMSHVKAIYDSLKENHWAFDSMDLLLTGGGCLMLAEELKYYFPDAQFTEDPINDNAKGFYNVGKMFYEEDN